MSCSVGWLIDGACSRRPKQLATQGSDILGIVLRVNSVAHPHAPTVSGVRVSATRSIPVEWLV